MDSILNYVETTNLTALGTIGMVTLFVAIFSLLMEIERTFNDIWGIERGRPTLRRLADYTSVMVICPLLFLLATAVIAPLSSGHAVGLIASFIEPLLLGQGQRFAEIAASVIVYTVGLSLGYLIFISAFTFLYIFVPNTRVRFLPGLTAGLVAALLWQTAQWGYLKSQVGLARYNAIYATFASFPIFLIWLYLSWQIVLFGAEVSFAHQNESEGHMLPFVEGVGFHWRTLAALLLMLSIGRRFVEGRAPTSVRELSDELRLPPRMVGEILNELSDHGLVVEAIAGERSFVPGRSLDAITVQQVTDALRRTGEERILLHDDAATRHLKHLLGRARDAESGVLGTVTLRQAIEEIWRPRAV